MLPLCTVPTPHILLLTSAVLLGLAGNDSINERPFWLDELLHLAFHLHDYHLLHWLLDVHCLDPRLGPHPFHWLKVWEEVARLHNYLLVGFKEFDMALQFLDLLLPAAVFMSSLLQLPF